MMWAPHETKTVRVQAANCTGERDDFRPGRFITGGLFCRKVDREILKMLLRGDALLQRRVLETITQRSTRANLKYANFTVRK